MLYVWKRIFKSAFHTDIQQTLTRELLQDPENDITCGLLYIYTTETFIYGTLNTATRDHDPSKIHTLGPYAAALSWSVAGAEYYRPTDPESLAIKSTTSLYRGLTLP